MSDNISNCTEYKNSSEEIDYESDFNYIPLMNEWEEIEGLNKIIIDKQSILNTINQIE